MNQGVVGNKSGHQFIEAGRMCKTIDGNSIISQNFNKQQPSRREKFS